MKSVTTQTQVACYKQGSCVNYGTLQANLHSNIYIYTQYKHSFSFSHTALFFSLWHNVTIIQLSVLVRLSDTGKVLQHVSNGELHSDSRPRVAAVYQALKVLVLPNELVLHDVPHDLVDRTKFTLNNLKTFEI